MSLDRPERLHALDAVRAGALLLGVLFHASLSFFPGFPWIVTDNAPSAVLATVVGATHIFRMSVFFLIAGFFAHMSFHRRGLRGFVVDRLKRIGVPLVVGWPLLFVAFIAVVIWAAIKANGGAPLEPQAQPPLTWRTVPLLHLWFLYVLLWLYAGVLALVGAARLLDRGGRLGRATDAVVRALVKSQLAPVALSLPLFAVYALGQPWMAWGGVQTPDTGLLPNLAAMVAFGTAFGFGWLLHRQMELLSVWRRWWPAHLALAVVLTVLVDGFLGDGPLVSADPGLALKLGAAAAYPLAVWTWTIGLVGLAMQLLSGHNRVVRYVADSSYWLYLIHLPIVMAGQVIVADMAAPWFVKLPAMVAVATALMLASYQLLVRNTPIGALLNGRRYGKRKPKKDDSVTPPAPQPSLT